MLITEARDLVAVYDQNQHRIERLRRALAELKPEFSEHKTTSARLTVQVGPLEPTITADLPKHLAVAILGDELKRLAGEQAAIEARLKGVA